MESSFWLARLYLILAESGISQFKCEESVKGRLSETKVRLCFFLVKSQIALTEMCKGSQEESKNVRRCAIQPASRGLSAAAFSLVQRWACRSGRTGRNEPPSLTSVNLLDFAEGKFTLRLLVRRSSLLPHGPWKNLNPTSIFNGNFYHFAVSFYTFHSALIRARGIIRSYVYLFVC